MHASEKNLSTKVQHVSFEYFTSRGCSTNRGMEVNWVTTMPNSLSINLICCLGPCKRHTLSASKIFKTYVLYLRTIP